MSDDTIDECLSDTNLFFNRKDIALDKLSECKKKFLYDLDILKQDVRLENRYDRWSTSDLIQQIYKHGEIPHESGIRYDGSNYNYFKEDKNITNILLSVPSREEIIYRNETIFELYSNKELCTKVTELSELLYKINKNNDTVNDSRSSTPSKDEMLQAGFNAMILYKDIIDISKDIKGSSPGIKSLKKIIGEYSKSKTYEQVEFVLWTANKGLQTDLYLPKENIDRLRFRAKARFKTGKAVQEQELSAHDIVKFGEMIYHVYIKEIRKVTKSSVNSQLQELGASLEQYTSYARYFQYLESQGFDICKPKILPKEKKFQRMHDAKNPMLMESLDVSKIVGNDFSINKDKRALIVDGPNNGGKTIYLKTIGINELFAQKGLLAVAKSATVSQNDWMFTHFEEREDIQKQEGKLVNAVRRMKEIFEEASEYSMIFSDEPYTGTAHEDSLIHTKTFLQGIDMLGGNLFMSTHLHELSKKIRSISSIQKFHVGFTSDENGGIIPNYKIEKGPAGKSYSESIMLKEGFTFEDIKQIIQDKKKPQTT